MKKKIAMKYMTQQAEMLKKEKLELEAQVCAPRHVRLPPTPGFWSAFTSALSNYARRSNLPSPKDSDSVTS